jgi:hypothetical protein
MSNFILLLISIVIIYIIARWKKDAKIGITLISILGLGLIVGIGVGSLVDSRTKINTNIPTIITNADSMQSITPIVLDAVQSIIEFAGQNTARDSVIIVDVPIKKRSIEMFYLDDS